MIPRPSEGSCTEGAFTVTRTAGRLSDGTLRRGEDVPAPALAGPFTPGLHAAPRGWMGSGIRRPAVYGADPGSRAGNAGEGEATP